MITMLGFFIFGEIILTLIVVLCFLNEQALIAFEDRVIFEIKRSLKRRRAKKACKYREKFNSRVEYTPVKPRRKSISSKDAA